MFSSVETKCSSNSEFRSALLWAATKLYFAKQTHTPAEEQQFTALVLGLLNLVDRGTWQAFAKTILQYPNVPLAIPHSLILNDLMSGAVTCNGQSLKNDLASSEELSELFFSATPSDRRQILLNLPYSALKPDLTIPMNLRLGGNEWLEAAALARNSQFFAYELQRTVGISHPCARRIVEDPWGEPIVVLALGLGMSTPALKRILLCLNAAIGRDAHRLYNLVKLHREIAPDAALRLIAIWKH